jgi:hypothetical protein
MDALCTCLKFVSTTWNQTSSASCMRELARAAFSSIRAAIHEPTGHVFLALKISIIHDRNRTSLPFWSAPPSSGSSNTNASPSDLIQARIASKTNFAGLERALPSEMRLVASSASLKVRRTRRQPTRHILKPSNVTKGLSGASERDGFSGHNSARAGSRSVSC